MRSDDATDGQTYTFQLYYDTGDDAGNPKIHNGDSISAELQCINRGVYDYYRTLRDVTGASNTATPANPPDQYYRRRAGRFLMRVRAGRGRVWRGISGMDIAFCLRCLECEIELHIFTGLKQFYNTQTNEEIFTFRRF